MRGAVHTLRDAGFDNVSLDLIYGIPGQSTGDLERDLAEALALEPEHLSCYELEAKPGTRFTHAHGEELERQADAMEDYFERVVETLTGAGYRWYETANFCRRRSASATFAPGTTSATGSGATISGSASAQSRPSAGCGGGTRRACRATWPRWAGANARSGSSSRSRRTCRRANASCSGSGSTNRCGREGIDAAIDVDALTTLERQGLVVSGTGTLRLTPRGRFLGGGVTAELLV